MGKRSVKSRAQELLEFAHSLQDSGLTWVEANNAIYGPGSRFMQLFPTKMDRVAFTRTAESRQIDALKIDRLPEPDVRPSRQEYSGKFVVRVPKSLHAALAAEAEAEGVSLNQLVVAKLSLQLACSVKSAHRPCVSVSPLLTTDFSRNGRHVAVIGTRLPILPGVLDGPREGPRLRAVPWRDALLLRILGRRRLHQGPHQRLIRARSSR